MKYLIYTRVSPKGSDWVGTETTVVDQATQCRAFVTATDPEGQIIDTIEDEFESGGSAKRPGWLKIINDVKQGTAQWDVLVVRHLDRFSRSIADAVNALELFHTNGKHLIATAQGLNSSNPSGRGVINILLSIAQMEREFAGERTKLKMHSIAAQGLWPVGQPPYGYKRGKKHDNKLYIHEEKAEIVKQIYLRYKAGVGPLELARDYSIPKNSVLYMLRNKTYLGLVCYDGKEHKGQHKPIISHKLYNEVQATLPQTTSAPRPNRQKYPYLLTGIIYCQCGRAMSPSSAHGRSRRYHYYKCTNEESCKNSVSAEQIEQSTLNTLASITLSKADISVIIEEIKLLLKKQESRAPEESDLKKALMNANQKKERITKMFIDGLITADNAALMNQRLTQATEEANQLTGQLDAAHARANVSSEAIQEMIAFARNLSNLAPIIKATADNPKEKKLIIGTWVKEIRRTGKEWAITLNLPGSPNCTNWLRKLDLNEPILLFQNDLMRVYGMAV